VHTPAHHQADRFLYEMIYISHLLSMLISHEHKNSTRQIVRQDLNLELEA